MWFYIILSVPIQDGRVLIKKVANLLLCIYAQSSVGLGLLKAKVNLAVLVKPHPLSGELGLVSFVDQFRCDLHFV